mmetsp:Transcript_8688/g.20626  ORF Transcript_8688/g.20626 Transcript_8688/m.20626 type:complete len:220 (-) Transcript_8688:249-908(-)
MALVMVSGKEMMPFGLLTRTVVVGSNSTLPSVSTSNLLPLCTKDCSSPGDVLPGEVAASFWIPARTLTSLTGAPLAVVTLSRTRNTLPTIAISGGTNARKNWLAVVSAAISIVVELWVSVRVSWTAAEQLWNFWTSDMSSKPGGLLTENLKSEPDRSETFNEILAGCEIRLNHRTLRKENRKTRKGVVCIVTRSLHRPNGSLLWTKTHTSSPSIRVERS